MYHTLAAIAHLLHNTTPSHYCSPGRLQCLLARIRLWGHEVSPTLVITFRGSLPGPKHNVLSRQVDDHIAFAAAPIALRTVQLSDHSDEALPDSLAELLQGGPGTMKSEFTSPSPAAGA